MHFDKFKLEGLDFPMEVKEILKFERPNRLNTGGQQCGIIVFELTGTVLSPLHKTNYDQPQIDFMLYENHCCLITKLVVY